MPSYLNIDAMGHAGAAAEMRYTPSGQAVTSFSLAVTRKWQKDGEWKSETTWLRVQVWGDAAERAAKIEKGDLVIVRNCRLMPDEGGGPKIFDRRDGSKGASYEVTAGQVIRVGKVQKDEQPAPGTTDEEPPF
jgi:single-strand DNA-binding protein